MEEVGQPHASAALRQVIYSPKSLLNRKLGGFQKQYKLFGKEQNYFPCQETKTQILQPIAQSLY
jgi:hypothetical protein